MTLCHPERQETFKKTHVLSILWNAKLNTKQSQNFERGTPFTGEWVGYHSTPVKKNRRKIQSLKTRKEEHQCTLKPKQQLIWIVIFVDSVDIPVGILVSLAYFKTETRDLTSRCAPSTHFSLFVFNRNNTWKILSNASSLRHIN